MIPKNRTVKYILANLPGGLANQVMVFVYLQKMMLFTPNHKYILFGHHIDGRHTDGKYDIRSFRFDSFPINIYHPPKIINNVEKILLKLFIKFPLFKNLFLKLFNIRIIDDMNFNSEIYNQYLPKKNIFLNGFFFNPSLIENDIWKKIELKNYCEESIDLMSRIDFENSIAIHVRLGDFLFNLDSHGVLSEKYYLKILSTVLRPGKKIYLFSNDSFNLHKYFPNLIEISEEVIISQISDPAEVLMIISKFNIVLTANSTFSFLAGIFKGDDGLIYAPAIFNKNNQNLSCEIVNRSNWAYIAPIWLNKL